MNKDIVLLMILVFLAFYFYKYHETFENSTLVTANKEVFDDYLNKSIYAYNVNSLNRRERVD